MLFGSGNQKYELVDEWAELPAGVSFYDIGRARVDDDDNVIVLNRGEHPVTVFDTTGDRRSAWGQGRFSDRPHGMGIGPEGNIYCTDDGAHTVKKFTPDGDLLMTLGAENEPSDTGYRESSDTFEQVASITQSAGPFNRPTGVTVFDSGEIFVADGYGNARVHKFSPEGNLVQSFGKPGADPGHFRVPHSIQHDNKNRLWVTDRENSRVQIFDADGDFITEWTDLIRPTDVVIDGDVVFITELCKRLSVFTIEGELLTRWGNEQHTGNDPLFIAPHTIAVDSNGDLYVGEASYTYEGVDRGAQTIQKFERAT